MPSSIVLVGGIDTEADPIAKFELRQVKAGIQVPCLVLDVEPGDNGLGEVTNLSEG
jgi:hypothetical protein